MSSDDEIRRAVRNACARSCRRAGAAFILNDRPDLAAELGCDGVHIGQEDASYAEARAAMGPDAHCRRHLPRQPPSGDGSGRSGRGLCRVRRLLSRPPTKDAQDPAPTSNCCTGGPEMMVVPVRRHRRHHACDECAAPLIEAGADFLRCRAGVWEHRRGPGSGGARRFQRAVLIPPPRTSVRGICWASTLRRMHPPDCCLMHSASTRALFEPANRHPRQEARHSHGQDHRQRNQPRHDDRVSRAGCGSR